MNQLVTYVGKSLPGLGSRLELTSNIINNYVEVGLAGEKYSREALAKPLIICLMKLTTPLEIMKTLLHPSDGTDSVLYTVPSRTHSKES